MTQIKSNKDNVVFILNSIDDAVISTDNDGFITGLNPSAEKMMGISWHDSVGKSLIDVLDMKNEMDGTSVVERCLDIIKSGEKYDLSNGLILTSSDGTQRRVSEHSSPLFDKNGDLIGLVMLIRDISKEYQEKEDKKRMEEQLIHAGKMSAIGTLANGIAHEFNNINAVIKGHIDLIMSRPGAVSEEVYNQLAVVQKAVNRGSVITSDLLTYSSDANNGYKKVTMYEIVKDVIDIIDKEFTSEGIKIFIDKDDDQEVCVNPDKMVHVIMNLMINAKHAMVDAKHKVITIEMGKDKDMFYWKVSDTGCGIDDYDLRHVFNPFFSTKGENAPEYSAQRKVKGCGLGLSVCQTLVTKHHKGKIKVDSKVGKGTSITVLIPKLEVTEKKESDDRQVEYGGGNGEFILILENEEEIRNLITNVVKNEGYSVYSTDDGKDALEVHKTTPFDLVIVDLKMPNMSGEKFLQEIQKLPNQPTKIVLTGKPTADISKLDVFKKIAKPFDFPSLLLGIYRGLRIRKLGK